MPTSPSLPASSSSPPSDSAVGASTYDRMQADVKALQQQAQATQASLKKLQTQESVDPVAAIASGLPAVPAIGGTGLFVASALVVALALVWWYRWRRPQNQLEDAGHTGMSDLAADSVYGQPQQLPTQPTHQTQKAPLPVQQSSEPDEPPQPGPTPASQFAKPEPTMGFDSEAAATEVIRVRKSLAEKREARFLLRDQEEPATADAWSMPGERSYVEAAPSLDIDIHFTLPDDLPEPEFVPEPEPQRVADSQPVSTELDINIDEAEEEAFAGIAAEPDPILSGPAEPDYATMLALAQVSEELEQLNEARDLAHEVMASDDPALRSEARALLDRLSEVESEMGPESIRWDDLR